MQAQNHSARLIVSTWARQAQPLVQTALF